MKKLTKLLVPLMLTLTIGINIASAVLTTTIKNAKIKSYQIQQIGSTYYLVFSARNADGKKIDDILCDRFYVKYSQSGMEELIKSAFNRESIATFTYNRSDDRLEARTPSLKRYCNITHIKISK